MSPSPTRSAERRRAPRSRATGAIRIPSDRADVELEIGGRSVRLTNLAKPFWPALGLTKRDLLQYYSNSRRSCCPTCGIARW